MGHSIGPASRRTAEAPAQSFRMEIGLDGISRVGSTRPEGAARSSAGRASSPEHLLGHASFVRHVARALLDHEDRLEDVVQQTWLAALERPPRKTEGLASWLKTVCTNFAFRS